MPENQTLECPVCGFGEFYTQTYMGGIGRASPTSVFYFGKRQKKRCLQCGTGFVYPAFRADELDEYYAKEYWQDRSQRANTINLDFTRAEQHYAFLLNALNTSATILDFGCGRGEFSLYLRAQRPEKKLIAFDKSDFAKERLEKAGVEFTRDLASCRGVDIFYSSHSLEHRHDLRESMERFVELTTENAFFFFEVPNVSNAVVFDLAPHLPHTYMFCPASFMFLAERYNLDVIGAKTGGISWAEKLRVEDIGTLRDKVYFRVLLRKRRS